jgi:hypothetical protein
MRNEKEHIIGDKTFIIPEITPQKGCHWAKKIIGMGATGDVMDAISKLLDMPFEEFKQLQGDFLSDARVVLESGRHQFIDAQGNQRDLSITGPNLLELTIVALVQGLSPFFDQALGKRIGGILKPLFQTLGLTTSSTSQSEQSNGDSVNSGTELTESAT